MEIASVSISQLRSIRSCALQRLDRFNVLIGRNNAGKSAVLDAVRAALDALSARHVVHVDPMLSAADDTHSASKDPGIRVQVRFALDQDEAARLISQIKHLSPQTKGLFTTLTGRLFLETGVAFELAASGQSVASIDLVRIGSGDAEDSVWRTLYQPSPEARAELAARALEIQLVRAESRVAAQMADDMDSEDWDRLKAASERVRYPYYFRHLASAPEEVQERLRRLIGESESRKEFGDTISTHLAALESQESALRRAEVRAVITTLTGDDTRVPRYMDPVLEMLAAFRVLYLRERRKPVGRDEAQKLLNLKVTRGGGQQLEAIKSTVASLLGVQIDAFQATGSTGPRRRSAELDVDDFLVEANGAGIREALRLILDFEFERPNLLLVEEPEVHLHPALEAVITEYLRERSSESQVILTTHSTGFVDQGGEGNSYLIQKRDDEGTVAVLLDVEEAQRSLPLELGLRLSALFMYERLVFVEGPSDADALRQLCETLGVPLAQAGVGFVPMGGSTKYSYYASEHTLGFLTKRLVSIIFLMDGDELSETDRARVVERAKQDTRVHVLDRRELENYFFAPRALHSYIKERVLEAKPGSSVPTLEKVSEDLEECIEECRLDAVRKRLASRLLRPYYHASIRSKDASSEIATLEENLRACVAAQVSDAEARLEELPQVLEEVVRGTGEEWKTRDRRLALAPGASVMESLFARYGMAYRKTRDAVGVARHLEAAEVEPELARVLRSLGA